MTNANKLKRMKSWLYFFFALVFWGCETATQPTLRDQTVLWGLVATGVSTPFFELG